MIDGTVHTPAKTLVKSNILVPESGNLGESGGEEENIRAVNDFWTVRQMVDPRILVVLRSMVIYLSITDVDNLV